MSWLHRVQGIDISRCFEYTKAYEKVSPVQSGRVLDIGSYRSPFPIFLAQQDFKVLTSDLNPTISKQRKWVQRAVGDQVSLSICMANGTRLPLGDCMFDSVTCISTIEHLPENGDRLMVREIERVLKSGGHCFISVPYAVSMREGTWGRWFQRWYDVTAASMRLVQPSGLTLVERGFLMGGKIGKLADAWYKLPRLLRHALSWSHVFLFPKAFEIDQSDQSDARVLWLLLQKP